MKATPTFGVLTKWIALRPGSCTALTTPSVSSAIRPICLMASEVRSSEAPSGSSTPANRYCLSWVGMKPPGIARKPTTVTTISTA